MDKKKRINKDDFVSFFTLIAGAVIAAFAIEEFLVPNTILDGGVIGVGIMINTLTGIPLSILTIVLNVPFLIAGAKRFGNTFIIKAAVAMVVFSVAIEIFEPWSNATEEYLLAVCFGGVILGLGVGLVIRSGGCLDGTETVAIILNRKFQLSVGQMVLVMNIIIYSVAGILFGFDRAMYSLLTYFITSKVIDIVETGLNKTKAAMIITEDADTVANLIYKTLGRTVTIMEGEGLVSGKKAVLYCVLTGFEVHTLKNIINSLDTSAFIAVSDVSEIIGNHIKKTIQLEQKGV
ncbi:MAG: YitT family protein [Lachnospiraceae bacterium]|nr:YitT family protein [Lachnospiraceae bacterium]